MMEPVSPIPSIVCPCGKQRVGQQGWEYTDLLWIGHTGESRGA